MVVKVLADDTLGTFHAEGLTAVSHSLEFRHAEQVLRIDVGRQVGLLVLTRQFAERSVQIRSRDGHSVAVEVAGEVAADGRTVAELDVSADDDSRTAAEHAADGQARTEQEERDVAGAVELHYLREDGKRRIVYHHAVIRIDRVLVAAARVEGPQYGLAREVSHRADILHDSLVHVLRRPALIRRARDVGELGDEALVIAEHDGVLRAAGTLPPYRHLPLLAVAEQGQLLCLALTHIVGTAGVGPAPSAKN